MANSNDGDPNDMGIMVINGVGVPMTRGQCEEYAARVNQEILRYNARMRQRVPVAQRSTTDRETEAIDLMTKSVKTFNDAKAGTETSEEAAREKARTIAQKAGISNA